MEIVGNNQLKVTKDEKITVVISEENSPILNEAMHTRGESILFNDETEIIKVNTDYENEFVLIKFNDVLNKITLFYQSDNAEGQKWGLLNNGFSPANENNIHEFTVNEDTTILLSTEQTLFAVDDPYALDFGDDKTLNSNLISNIPNALVLDLENKKKRG